jgi:hypothetical protein
MATNDYKKIATMKLWKNDAGKATHGNGSWQPWVDGSNTDITLRGDQKYSVRLFDNEDDTVTIQISQRMDASVSVDKGLRKVESSISLNDTLDDIPF